MRNLLIILLLLSSNLSFSQKGTVILNDSSSVATVAYTYQLSNLSLCELSHTESKELPKLIKSFIKQYNSELTENADDYGSLENALQYKIKSIGTYRLQIVPFINEQSEKEVWINGFCDRQQNWNEQIVWVMDGGNCFFSMRINLTTRTLISAGTNGYA